MKIDEICFDKLFRSASLATLRGQPLDQVHSTMCRDFSQELLISEILSRSMRIRFARLAPHLARVLRWRPFGNVFPRGGQLVCKAL